MMLRKIRTKNMWARLPNAKYVELILSDLRENQKAWRIDLPRNQKISLNDSARIANEEWGENRSAALKAASDAITMLHKPKGRTEFAWYDQLALDGVFVAQCAMLALITYPDTDRFIRMDLEHIKLMTVLGDHKAILMYPAVLILSQNNALKELK